MRPRRSLETGEAARRALVLPPQPRDRPADRRSQAHQPGSRVTTASVHNCTLAPRWSMSATPTLEPLAYLALESVTASARSITARVDLARPRIGPVHDLRASVRRPPAPHPGTGRPLATGERRLDDIAVGEPAERRGGVGIGRRHRRMPGRSPARRRVAGAGPARRIASMNAACFGSRDRAPARALRAAPSSANRPRAPSRYGAGAGRPVPPARP